MHLIRFREQIFNKQYAAAKVSENQTMTPGRTQF